MENNISLDNIIVKSKTVEVDYPYSKEGFTVEVAYLTKDEILSIRKQATKSKMNKYSRVPEDIMDEELFTEYFVAATIKGWSGLTFEILETMVPISNDSDKTAVMPYSEVNAMVLMRNSSEFDNWVAEIAGDLSAFTTGK